MTLKNILTVVAAISLLSSLSFAQLTEFHPELNWLTIKGEHVVVHYHEETERTARTVLKIAEDVWDPITSLYEYEPETVHFVIKDIDDYSNGATYFFDNKIEIWSSALDTDLRGTHNWLRNVISHEFTHMVQTQASLKASRRIPAVYMQFLNYEDKRRPDILYGFPNVIATYPVAFINIPHWFSEGTAQYMRREFGYDYWDSHRDMILRSYVLDGNMLTWNQMGVFDKNSLGNESVYNSGFALVNYIASTYGEDKLRKLSRSLGRTKNFTMDAALEDVLGKSGRELYDEWKKHLTEDYNRRIADVRLNNIKGSEIRSEGFGNFYPLLSADGSQLLYVTNKGADYLGLSGIYLYNLKTGKEKLLVNGVRSTISRVPGQNKIVYAKLSEDNPGWANIHDIYVYDIDKKEEYRLTYGLRANQPSVSSDGRMIVFSYQKDGTGNIGIVETDGDFSESKIKTFRPITFYSKGEQIFSPRFYNNDSSVVFDYSDYDSRDLAKVNVDASGLKTLLKTSADERNPFVTKDGILYFSSDESGIFNIYSMDLRNGNKAQLTNVLGGAFMPSVDDSGNIAYAGYTSSGYKIFLIDNNELEKVDPTKRYIKTENLPLSASISNGDITRFNIDNLKNYDDSVLPDVKSEPYGGAFTKMTFFPFIRFDNYTTSNSIADKIKPGVFVNSTDMLDRYSLFAGGSINKRMERDLFFTLEYRNKLPYLFDIGIKPELSLELYNITRKANTDLLLGADTVGQYVYYDYEIPVDVTYSLFEADLAAKHRIFKRGNELEFRFIFSRYVSTIGNFFHPENSFYYPKTNDTYLIGRNFQLLYTHRTLIPYIDDDINPIGMTLDLQYNYELNKFNPDGNYEDTGGMLKPVYKNFNFHRVELNQEFHIPLWKGHTVNSRIRAASILGPNVPDFFDYYLGGLVGMKSYPFYAVSGNELAWVNFTYRFPLFRNLDARAGHFYLDKIFMSLYADMGNAWNGDIPKLDKFKKGAGAELRIKMNSFYLFPTSIFFNAAYSFDRADRVVRNENVRYGQEWQFYGGILFDFSF